MFRQLVGFTVVALLCGIASLPLQAQQLSSMAGRAPMPPTIAEERVPSAVESRMRSDRLSTAQEQPATDSSSPNLHTAYVSGPAIGPSAQPWLDPYAMVGPCAPPPQLSPPAPMLGSPLPPGPLLVPPPTAGSERFWLRGEYLLWWAQGMRTPPLVTTSPAGTLQPQAGVLGEPNTSILFGGNDINEGPFNGFRARGGVWLNPVATVGIGGEYFQLFDEGDGFSATSDGTTILARPFFDITNDQQTAQLVGFPGVVRGDIQVTSSTELKSAAIHGRIRLLPTVAAPPFGYGGNSRNRVDWLVGYRYMELEDSLQISDNLVSLIPAAPGTIVAQDAFRTDNDFHGLDLGVVHQANWDRLWLETLIKVAIGNNRQQVNVSGNSVITEAGVTTPYTGGLLAQRTNIGSFERNEFAIVPELGATLGFRIRPRLSLTVGYSLVYFSNVVRAGDQIDTDLNPNLFPPEVVPFTGSERPRPIFRETDFWAHGLSIGGDLRF